MTTCSTIPVTITLFPASNTVTFPLSLELAAMPPPTACSAMQEKSMGMKIQVYCRGLRRERAGSKARTMCLRVRLMPAARKEGARMMTMIWVW